MDAIAAKDASRQAVAGDHQSRSRISRVEIEANLAGITAKSATGETLTAPKVDSVNTFEAPDTVVPKPISAKVQGGKLALKLEPKSVTVISIEQ